MQKYLHIVQDRALRITERVEGFRQLLQNILSVNLTGASIAQNDQVKKISAWAAILFAPTLIGTVYGMNFDYMPELHWTFGYPFALVLMLMVSVTLYLVFKRRGFSEPQSGLFTRVREVNPANFVMTKFAEDHQQLFDS